MLIAMAIDTAAMATKLQTTRTMAGLSEPREATRDSDSVEAMLRLLARHAGHRDSVAA